jgi:hypothetical protein
MNGNLEYFAGLMDGEAHIALLRCCRRDRGGLITYAPRIIVSMLDKPTNVSVLQSLKDLFGGSLYTRKPWEYRDRVRISHRQQMAWEVRYTKAFEALKVLQPFLRIKKRHADLILSCKFRSHFRVTEQELQQRELVYLEIRTLNDGRKRNI